jgi:hypothetical protein
MSTQDIDGIYLQERDFAVLRGLYESRVMTVAHAMKLFFDGKLEATRKRLQKLKAAGLIRDRARAPTEPAVMQLTMRGFRCLKRNDQLADFPVITEGQFEGRCRVSSLTLNHELAVMDVKTALVAALSRLPDVRILEATTWPLLSQFRVRPPAARSYAAGEITVKPDGFLRFTRKTATDLEEHSCFIEVDRGTESLRVLVERAVCYRAHYRSGGFAISRGGSREQLEQYPFRVLVIFTSEERRNNMAERLLALDPPIRTMTWLTTMPEILQNPLDKIWVRPVDYQEVLPHGVLTLFATHRLVEYRRQLIREELVEKYVQKLHLLGQ